jgi:hypothetical protein
MTVRLHAKLCERINERGGRWKDRKTASSMCVGGRKSASTRRYLS